MREKTFGSDRVTRGIREHLSIYGVCGGVGLDSRYGAMCEYARDIPVGQVSHIVAVPHQCRREGDRRVESCAIAAKRTHAF